MLKPVSVTVAVYSVPGLNVLSAGDHAAAPAVLAGNEFIQKENACAHCQNCRKDGLYPVGAGQGEGGGLPKYFWGKYLLMAVVFSWLCYLVSVLRIYHKKSILILAVL